MEKEQLNFYNLRVYGIVINHRNEILLSDEHRFKQSFTKFPGGGLEFGEGLKDGLRREFIEEFDLPITVKDLFYVNDFLQVSAFNPKAQLFSFYFEATFENIDELIPSEHTIPLKMDGEKLRWVPIEMLSSKMVTFPIDKLVVEKIIKTYR